MKVSALLDLIKEAIEAEDVNKCNELLDLIEHNRDKFKPEIFDRVEFDLKDFIKEKSGKKLEGDNKDVILYDFSKFELRKPSWYELWDREKFPTFAKFFSDYVLPTFHNVPFKEIQHPIMSTFALYNVATIPNEGKKPNGICCGFSRTGKSKFAERCMKLLPKKFSTTIKGNSSPLAITSAIHKVCYVSGEPDNYLIRPSVSRFDNIYWEDFINRLDIHYVTLLALEKGDAICEIAGKNGGIYHTFSKYIFTTVEPPVRDTPRMDELLNRSFTFYFDRGYEPDIEPTLYNWDGFDKEYLELWNKKDVEEKFFKVLSEVSAIRPKESTLTLEKLEISKIMIATGIYLDLYKDIPEALEIFKNYWDYVDSKQSNIGSLLFKLCSNYLNDYYYNEFEWKKSLLKTTKVDVRIKFSHLKDELYTKSHGIINLNSKLTKEIEDILLQHDLILVQNGSGLEFVRRDFL